jgi:hypothetical protein
MQQGVSGPLWAMTLAQASSLVASQKISPLDLVDACLERITEVDAKLHTYIHVAAEHARAEAKHAADEIANGRCRGALHGLPFAVKDNYDVAGMPATANSKLRLKHIPQQDAGLVRKLRHAGAILLGKLATWEYGTGNGGDYFDLPFPSARNPWDTSAFHRWIQHGCRGQRRGRDYAVCTGLRYHWLSPPARRGDRCRRRHPHARFGQPRGHSAQLLFARHPGAIHLDGRGQHDGAGCHSRSIACDRAPAPDWRGRNRNAGRSG